MGNVKKLLWKYVLLIKDSYVRDSLGNFREFDVSSKNRKNSENMTSVPRILKILRIRRHFQEFRAFREVGVISWKSSSIDLLPYHVLLIQSGIFGQKFFHRSRIFGINLFIWISRLLFVILKNAWNKSWMVSKGLYSGVFNFFIGPLIKKLSSTIFVF